MRPLRQYIAEAGLLDLWLLNGRTAPTIESAEHREELLSAFAHGWADKLDAKGNDGHRSYPLPNGAKLAYMVGRQLAPRMGRTDGLDPKTPFYRDDDPDA